MTADKFLSNLTQFLYVISLIVTVREAVRRPRRVTIDTSLFFGVTAVITASSWILQTLQLQPSVTFNAATSAMLMSLPYLLLRLVDDFVGVPRWLMRLSAIALAMSVIGLAVFPKLPGVLPVVYVIDFVSLEVYAAIRFVREAGRTVGTTRRRMLSAAIGSLCLGLFLAFIAVGWVIPTASDIVNAASLISAMLSGVGYLFAFAPPSWVRRLWQIPEVLAFLRLTARLPQLGDYPTILAELEKGIAASLGASGAAIAMWDEAGQHLELVARAPLVPEARDAATPEFAVNPQTGAYVIAPGELVSGQVFATQKPVFIEDIAKFDSKNAEKYTAQNASSLLGVPLVAGDSRLGVVLVYAARPSLFVEDDLALLQILADQAAVILQCHALIDEAGRARALIETARLKEDFFSAAAHDLRTPLTAFFGQVQLLRRRATARPDAPIELRSVQRLEDEARRLIRFTNELLDVTRADYGQLIKDRQPADLAALVQEAAGWPRSELHRVNVEGTESVVAVVDRVRIEQLLENLIENAIKYSPEGGNVWVSAWQDSEATHLSVRDEGIGIPASDVPHVFDQFFRGTNVNDRQYSGLGVGLYLCRSIVEGHGGKIAAESSLGKGTTIHVILPHDTGDRSGDAIEPPTSQPAEATG